jgi:DNA-binding IclR family transcriptional regulator
MAKKKPQAEKPRTDAERRARQCERISRALRVLQCIAGPGRWDVQALAEEIECSPRTVQRVLQVLGSAGVPYRFDPESRAYRVPANFRFPGLGDRSENLSGRNVLPHVSRMVRETEKFLKALQEFSKLLEE